MSTLIASSLSVIEIFARAVVEGIQNNIRNKRVTPFGAVDTTGAAAESVYYKIVDNHLIIASTWAYITVLEDGRRPGKFAPPGLIEQWIDNKPIIPTGISKKSLAFLINRSLKEKGSLIYRQGGHSGILSDVLNEEFLRENLTVPLQKAVIDHATKILFNPIAA